MFFRWPSDGAATLLGPSGRPLATSPAVQGAARDYGGGGAQTAAQGRKGCRRAERAGNQHHARLALYMDRAARWLRHTAPATATSSPEGGAPLFAPKRPPPPAVHGEWRTARRRPQRATSSAAPPPRQRRDPHCQHDGAPKTAASSAGSNTQRKPAPLAPAHVAATGGRSTKSGGERRGGARDCSAPRGTADGRASISRFPPLEPGSGSSTSGAPTWPTCPAAPAGLLVRGYKGKEAGRLGPPDASPAVPQLQADPDSGPYEGESGTFRLDKLLRLQHNIEV